MRVIFVVVVERGSGGGGYHGTSLRIASSSAECPYLARTVLFLDEDVGASRAEAAVRVLVSAVLLTGPEQLPRELASE